MNSYRQSVRTLTSTEIRRRGSSFVELLVVIGIIGLFVGLIAVAIQSSRETSRRLTCQDRLRQIQLAVTNFEASHKELPKPGKTIDSSPNPLMFGPFVQIADFLEIKFRVGNGNISDTNGRSVPTILQCPSIGIGLGYRFNVGIDWRLDGHTLHENGVIQHKRISLSTVTDGLSNTASLSERFSGNGTDAFDRAISTYVTPSLSQPSNFDLLCLAARSVGNLERNASQDWTSANIRDWSYHHTVVPHSTDLDCELLSLTPYWVSVRLTARSSHHQGVNLTLLDGSVHLIHKSIDVSVWRAWGTIQSND
jgi:hypothetical protein